MGSKRFSMAVGRRGVLKAGVSFGALTIASPFILKARGETPVRIGMVGPLTGVYAAIAQGEDAGCKLSYPT